MMVSPLNVPICIVLAALLSLISGMCSSSIRQNKHFTRVLMGRDKPPMKGSSALERPQPLDWKQAIRLLDSKLEIGFVPDIKTWTTVLRICQKSRESLATLTIFDRMKQQGIQPDRYAYQIAISSCLYIESSADSWKHSLSLLRECDAILPLDGNGGAVEGKVSLSIFSAVISVCERAGQGQVAIAIYELMARRRNLPVPDVQLVSSIVAACEAEEDWATLDAVLRDVRIIPDLTLYHQLIRIAGKQNDPKKAFQYIQTALRQGLRPTRGTYRELVEACQASVEMAPKGAYLLEQAKLLFSRSFPADDMEREEPKADFLLNGNKCTANNGPGSSYESNARKMLRTLAVTTNFRLHDHSALPESGQRISFGAAEELLAMHCEKQALAALLYSGEESNSDVTIDLTVNPCMCADCHMVFKYASQGFNRRIVCQDPSRKHCFEKGECSCQDHWPGRSRKSAAVDTVTFS